MKRFVYAVAIKMVLLAASVCLEKNELLAAPHLQHGHDRLRKGSISADWTVMIFLNADNNLEQDALANFRSMAKIGSSSKVNIIVQFDRIAKYAHTNPDWSQTLRFKVLKGMEPLPKNAIQDIGEANMGDPAVLKDFIHWAMTTYPAKHYMLDIWDHGSGYRIIQLNSDVIGQVSEIANYHSESAAQTRDFSNSDRKKPADQLSLVFGDPFRSSAGAPFKSCSNDETDKDELYNCEVQSALHAELKERKIDVIGFDCCLMAMVETAYAMRKNARVFVGSEDLEPGSGWAYDDWLKSLETDPSISGAELGKILVRSYKRIYGDANLNQSTTLSAISLFKFDSTFERINQFSRILNSKLDSGLPLIVRARDDCYNFAPNYSYPNPFYHIDFVRFCRLIQERSTDTTIKIAAKEAADAVESTVIYNYKGKDRAGNFGSNGLAIYFPPTRDAYLKDKYAKNGYEKGNTYYPVDFVENGDWTTFLHSYFVRQPK